jgi:alanyl-tRNA synthetase
LESNEIKRRFLDFFIERGHRMVESSSLIPDDPTLLLTTAGMVQFKPYFLGELSSDFSRATSAQKCVRTTDIDNVGHTARHLTFFEMLGNFSFGDYYKSDAARFAYDFLVSELGLPLDRLYFTIYEEDDEALAVWRDEVGVPEARIVRLGKDDNFWDMGETGPCGPCSEILYDQGPEAGCGRPECAPGCDCDRYLELWNLVFMQFDRDEQGSLNPLPKKNIDTGMGLERVASVLQGVTNNFETDLLRSLMDRMAGLAGVRYGEDAGHDTSLRIVADHARAMTFLISDGVLPSNEERGYILRRIIRRAVRHGRSLGAEKIFLPEMVEGVVELMGNAYPDLRRNIAFIVSMIRSEEERFLQTLRDGLVYLERSLASLRENREQAIPGEVVFHLHDTLGFPLELTREIASEECFGLDEEGFSDLMRRQKERARQARVEEGYSVAEKEVYLEVMDNFGTTFFDGYQVTAEKARVKAVIGRDRFVTSAAAGEEVEVVLDRTPFYGEMGGQVGDRGRLVSERVEVEITDVSHPLKGLFVHHGKVIRGVLEPEDEVDAEVDAERRDAIRRNHTATHLIHLALREILGEHAKQAGSLVDPEHLRFDFTHYAQLTSEELREMESRVNRMILADLPVRAYFTTYDYARSIDAVALFGEKYEEQVRVVEVDEVSRELCGGTHVGRTGEIGLCLFTSEGSVGANLRRLEAVTGTAAYHRVKEISTTLEDVSRLVKADPSQVLTRLEKMLQHQRELEKEAEKHSKQALSGVLEEVLEHGHRWSNGQATILTARMGQIPDKLLRDLADRALEKVKPGVVALVSEGEKIILLVAVSKDLVAAGLNAGELAKAGSSSLGGGGGGQPHMATGSGTRREGIEEALEKVMQAASAALAAGDA